LVADRVASVKALDFSENMIAMLRKGMADAGANNVEPHHGDGHALPMFGLMLFPDRAENMERSSEP
jgi:ubiquinone/menaquinone biosynthesis C-methylase UbiE